MAGDVKSWGLECCFACHKDLATPLHILKLREMGLKKIHRECYNSSLFITLRTEVLLLVSPRYAEEIWRPRVHCTHKDAKQPELFDD